MRELTEKDVEITITIEPEDIPIEGNASAIDDETDRETVAEIRCIVIVTAHWEDPLGVAERLEICLGFVRASPERVLPGVFLADMKRAAIDALNEKLRRLVQTSEAIAAALDDGGEGSCGETPEERYPRTGGRD